MWWHWIKKIKGSVQYRRYLRVGYVPGCQVKKDSRKFIKCNKSNILTGDAFRSVANVTNFKLYFFISSKFYKRSLPRVNTHRVSLLFKCIIIISIIIIIIINNTVALLQCWSTQGRINKDHTVLLIYSSCQEKSVTITVFNIAELQ
jgi:hypothetical protein